MASTDRRTSCKISVFRLGSNILSQKLGFNFSGQVPKEGDTIEGYFVPGGTIIG